MLQTGGQLFFLTFEKIPADDGYSSLDEGKWRKYDNLPGKSPFYKSNSPKEEYNSILQSLGYVDTHIFTRTFSQCVTEGVLEGKQ